MQQSKAARMDVGDEASDTRDELRVGVAEVPDTADKVRPRS